MNIQESTFETKRWEDYDTIKLPNGNVIDMQAVIDHVHRAKAGAIHLAPHFGGLLNNLNIVYTFKIQTMATDDYHLFINPEFVATQLKDLTSCAAVLCHEVMHSLLNHLRRGKNHDPYKSNIAADYECNITLVDVGLFKMGTWKKLDAYVDKKYSGWGYEKIYADCSSKSTDPMSNQQQSKDAEKRDANQGGDSQGSKGSSGSKGNRGGQGGSSQSDPAPEMSDAYKAGWAQAIADIKAGKLKI